MGRYGGVTAADKDDRMKIQALGPANALRALDRGRSRDAARVDDHPIRVLADTDWSQSQVFHAWRICWLS